MKRCDYSSILPGPQLETEVLKLRKAGNSLLSVKSILCNQLLNVKPSDVLAYQDQIDLEIKSYGSFQEAERIIAADICKTTNSDKYFIYDPVSKDRSVYNLSSLTRMFNENYLDRKTKILSETYDPYTDKVYLHLKGKECFNMYRPADWYADYFYKLKQAMPCTMPTIYHDFFTHLVNGDAASYNYLLQWIANSLTTRNRTFLVTIGEQGIGKGMLYELIANLHGKHNSAEILGKDFFNSNFNSAIENKTFFSIDELDKMNETDTNRLKKLESNTLFVERKGVDKFEVNNTMNIMLSSNDLSCFNAPAKERRFSIIELTKIRIDTAHWLGAFDEKNAEMKDPANIKALGTHLLTQVKVDKDLMRAAFKSIRQLEEINQSSILDWQDYFLFTFCQENEDKVIPMIEINTLLREKLNTNKITITKKGLRDLRKSYPGIYTEVNMPGINGRKGSVGIKIYALDQQPTKESFNLGTIVESEA